MFPWGQFPFSDEIKKMSENMAPEDVHSYVNKLMKKYDAISYAQSQHSKSE